MTAQLLRACTALALATVPQFVAAQGKGESPRYQFLSRPDAVVLHNASNQSIEFAIGPQGAPAREMQLSPQEARQFSLNQAEAYVIEVATDGMPPLRYRLNGSRRYQIYWNESRRLWDVTELVTER